MAGKTPARSMVAALGLAALAACTSPVMPGPMAGEASTTVDILDYLVGDASTWPRIGALYMNQVVDPVAQEICWVKYGNPRRFECWRWDDRYVYHETDNAIDGNTGESYHFSDGRWLPRYLPVGGQPWSLDVAANRLIWFTPQCTVDASRSGAFPYAQRAWLEGTIDAGGDLGPRETVILEYAPYDPTSGRSNPERFYFGRGAGWYRWSRDAADLQFNRRFSRVITTDRSVWCNAPEAAPGR